MMYLYVAFSNHLILNVFIHYNDKDAILQSSQRKIVIRKGSFIYYVRRIFW